MSRLIFFIREALRALRRNGAPSLAAIVTTVVTVVLLGVLIPIFQTTQAKSNQIRGELNLQFALYADATAAEIAALREDSRAFPTSSRSTSSARPRRCKNCAARIKRATDLGAAHQPAAGELQGHPRRRRQPARDPRGGDGHRRRRQADSRSRRSSTTPSAARRTRSKIEEVTSALKIVLTVITALLVLASLMLIGNTIRLSIFTRRREVEVMRLVGATRWFIRWPFMIEGVVVGFVGGLVAILILWLGKITIVDPLSSDFSLPRGAERQHALLPGPGRDSLRRRGPRLDDRLGHHPAALPQGLRPA